jgi:hypothetical protein
MLRLAFDREVSTKMPDWKLILSFVGDRKFSPTQGTNICSYNLRPETALSQGLWTPDCSAKLRSLGFSRYMYLTSQLYLR